MNRIALNELVESWHKRDLRERRIYAGVAFLVMLGFVYLVAVEPALSNIKKLEQTNPLGKQNAALIVEMAGQYAVISKTLSENVAPVTRETIESSLTRRNIKTQSLSVSNDVVRFQVNVVSYSNLMEWCLEMQRAARLTIEEIKLTSLTEPGHVSVVITLRQQRAVS